MNAPRRRRRRVRIREDDGARRDTASGADLNDRVRNMDPTPPIVMSEADSARDEDFTPVSRMHEVRSRASGYEREYRLRLLHRMLMRGVPLDEIARELDVSIRTVMRDRTELYSRIKEAAKKLDINLLIGDQMAFYKEASSMAMRVASQSKAPLHMRLMGIRTAVTAQNDMTRMLNVAGVFDALKWRPHQDQGGGDIRKLVALTEKLLAEDAGAGEGAPQALTSIPESELFNLPEEEEVVVL